MPELRETKERLRPVSGWCVERSAGGGLADCCLIIATYRRQEELMKLLDVLTTFPEGPGEVVVVDGASTDRFSCELWNWAHSRPVPFDLVYARSCSGLTRQRNVGVDLSTRRYVYFLDDDAIPLPGYFAEIRRVFEDDHSHQIGAVGGCITNEMNKPTVRRWRLRFALGLVPRMEPMKYHPSGTHVPRSMMKPFSGVRAVDIFFGGVCAIRREVFVEQRFSEFFDGYSQGEDTEMSLRIGRHWQVVCSGDAQVLHFPAPGGRPAGYVRAQMEIRNRMFIWKRHTPHPAPLDRIRFWADNWFLLIMDLAWFAARPWHFYSMAHAGGLIAGIVKNVVSPPNYEEPPAQRVHVLEMVAPEVTA